MSKLLAARTVQYPLFADFTFNFNDYVTDSVSGVKKTFGATVAVADPSSAVAGLSGAAADTIVFDAIPLPIGAVITGGALIVEAAFAGPTAATVSLGTAGSTTALQNAVDAKTVARTANSLITPLIGNSGQNLRLTFAYTVANATAGRVRLRVEYTIDGRANEVVVA